MSVVAFGVLRQGDAGSTMWASSFVATPWDLQRHPDVLSWSSVTRPQPQMGEVVIEVVSSSVQAYELRELWRAESDSYPHVPGHDFAGTVAAVGDGVKGGHLRVGDHVWGYSVASGAHAEYLRVPAEHVAAAPLSLPLIQTGALPSVSTVALRALQLAFEKRGPVRDLSMMVVLGGNTGIGHIAIALGRAIGVPTIVATCNAAERERCAGFGADRVLDDDWYREIRRGSVDFVFDTLGNNGTGDLAYGLLKDDAAFVTISEQAAPSWYMLQAKPSVRHALTSLEGKPPTLDELNQLRGFVDDNKAQQLRPYIIATYTPSTVLDAWRSLSVGDGAGLHVIDLRITSAHRAISTTCFVIVLVALSLSAFVVFVLECQRRKERNALLSPLSFSASMQPIGS